MSSEQNHESFSPHTTNDDHQCRHTENENFYQTIVAPHISIHSSSHNEFNSNFDHNDNEMDTSIHSININPFPSVNHDNSPANTSELINSIGYEVLNSDTRDHDFDQIECYDGDIEDVNDDDATDNIEEVGKFYGDGDG